VSTHAREPNEPCQAAKPPLNAALGWKRGGNYAQRQDTGGC